MPEQSYLKRAWADLTAKKGWYKPLLILGLVMCIPIIGPITAQGYLFDWAKEASWGLNRGLTRKTGSISRRIRYGLIATVICIVWLLPVFIVIALLALIPQIGSLIKVIGTILEIVACSIASVAVLRGLVYERIEPGLQFRRILKMAAHDTKNLIAPTIALAIVFVIFFLFNSATDVIYLSLIGMFDTKNYLAGGGSMFMSALMFFMFLAAVAYVITMILVTFFDALAMRMFGYWLAQFEPSKWGTPKDSMPFENEFAQAATNATPISPEAEAEQSQVNNGEHHTSSNINNGEHHTSSNVNNGEHPQGNANQPQPEPENKAEQPKAAVASEPAAPQAAAQPQPTQPATPQAAPEPQPATTEPAAPQAAAQPEPPAPEQPKQPAAPQQSAAAPQPTQPAAEPPSSDQK